MATEARPDSDRGNGEGKGMGARLTSEEKAWLGYGAWDTRWSQASLNGLRTDEERDQQASTEGWYDDDVSSKKTARTDVNATSQISD